MKSVGGPGRGLDSTGIERFRQRLQRQNLWQIDSERLKITRNIKRNSI